MDNIRTERENAIATMKRKESQQSRKAEDFVRGKNRKLMRRICIPSYELECLSRGQLAQQLTVKIGRRHLPKTQLNIPEFDSLREPPTGNMESSKLNTVPASTENPLTNTHTAWFSSKNTLVFRKI